MTEIIRFIDELFKNKINSKKTRQLKQQILTDAKNKFECLILNGSTEKEAIEKTIIDIKSSIQIADNPDKNTKLNIIASFLLFLFVVSLFYAGYLLINNDHYILFYNPMPMVVFKLIIKPVLFLSITFLILYFLTKFTDNMGHFSIHVTAIRFSFLFISLLMIVFYFLFISFILYSNFALPGFIYNTTLMISKNSYLFIFIGIFLFFSLNSNTKNKREKTM